MRGDVIFIAGGAILIFGILIFSLMKTTSQCTREEERREMEELIGKMK